MKKFLELRCESIRGQLKGEIPSETNKQKKADLITADFSINEMGSMGGNGGGPPMPGENGENAHGGMQPPNGQGGTPPNGLQPPNMQGGNPPDGMQPPDMQGGNPPGGMQPPPGMPGMTQIQDNTGYYATIVIALLVLCAAFIGAKMFKRNY